MRLSKFIILAVGSIATASPLDLSTPKNDAGDYIDRNKAEKNLIVGGCKYLMYSAVFATVKEGYQCNFFKTDNCTESNDFKFPIVTVTGPRTANFGKGAYYPPNSYDCYKTK